MATTSVSRELRVPKLVVIHCIPGANEYRFDIDGEMFPYFVSEEGFQLGRVARDAFPQVTFTIMAERIEVISDLAAHNDGPTVGA